MAISFLVSGEFSGTNANINVAVNQHFTTAGVALPAAGLQVGDTIIVSLGRGSIGATTPSVPTAGVDTSAFTALTAAIFGDDSFDVTLRLFAAKVTSIPALNSTTLYTINGSGNTANNQAIITHILRGVDFDNLIALTGGASVTTAAPANPNTSVPNPPSNTPTVAGSFILCAGAGGSSAAQNAHTVPTGLSATTNHFRAMNNTSSGTNRVQTSAGIKTDWASGAFDCPAFPGGSSAATSSWAAATLVIPPLVIGGKMKVWSGSAWVEKPVKVWTGSAWVEKPLKVWNGSAWVLS